MLLVEEREPELSRGDIEGAGALQRRGGGQLFAGGRGGMSGGRFAALELALMLQPLDGIALAGDGEAHVGRQGGCGEARSQAGAAGA
jgi:hypothetical protein